MKHVVFVMPPYPYSRSIGQEEGKRQIGLMPPLGVGYLTAYLERTGKYQCYFVDAVAERLSIEETVSRILSFEPDVIGISSFTTFLLNTSYQLARRLKEECPSIPLLMGGPHTTSFGEQVLKDCPYIDYVIPGDAEVPLLELLEKIFCGDIPDKVKG
ncbi:MAG: B12-binding domain-containing radical SAM protein, partial [Candidatus Hydrogenedens sp.]